MPGAYHIRNNMRSGAGNRQWQQKQLQMVYAMLVTFILKWEITQECKVPNAWQQQQQKQHDVCVCNVIERVRTPY